MRSESRGSVERYSVALGGVALALALARLPDGGTQRPLLLFNGAVILAAWYGGRGPATFAFVLATVAAAYIAVPPYGSFSVSSGSSVPFGIFVVETSVTAALTIAMTESRSRAEACARRCSRGEEQLRKLNKAYRALSISNETLVRAEDEGVLLEEICRAIVEVGGYRMCWVGRAEHDEAKTVRPVARAGYDDGYIDGAEVTWADTGRGRGPVGTAIRTARPFVPQDVASDPSFAPWRTEALARGYASVIALPLRIEGWVFGALAIYAAERNAFDEDAVRLLTELGNNLAYGIGALRGRACVAAERARIETAVMQAPVAVAVYTGPQHIVRLANRRWFALGRTLDAIGKPLRDILPVAAAAGDLAKLDEAYATGEPFEATAKALPCQRPDGSVETRYLNVACQPLFGPGRTVTDLIVAVFDVTDQVNAHRMVEEARVAAEKANRAKDDFLRIASHELRTPLLPILGWAELLKKTDEPKKFKHGIDIILANARAEVRLVDDLIDVSQIVAGTLKMEQRPVELGPLVQACVDDMRSTAAAEGVHLDVSIAPDTILWGDAARLAQVARNLISNAIKFTPRGGSVRVEVARQGEALLLRVRDTGPGIPPNELPHVFEPFHIGDASTTRAYRGLGLGLCIVRYIVEAHGGTVRVESSRPGSGTTLTVELPPPDSAGVPATPMRTVAQDA